MTESKVDLICTEQKGRCFITNQAASQGEILFVWKPYILVPYVTEKDYVCANCIHVWSKQSTDKNKMITCRQGCSYVIYCSNECEEQHWNEFHQYECSFLDKVFDLKDLGYSDDVVNYGRLVLRVLTKRLREICGHRYDMSIEDVWVGRSHFDNFVIEKKNEFKTVAKILTEYVLTRLVPSLSKNNPEFNDCVQSFLPDSEDVTKVEMDDLDLWLNGLVIFYSISNDAITFEAIKVLLKKVYILICIEEINALFHITFTLEGYTQPPQTYAMGIYPSAAFVNHSCTPNIARFPVQENRDNYVVGDVVFFATRSLRKGEEVCYSYLEREYELYTKKYVDASEFVKSQEKRKQRLKDEFFFDCDCTRCLMESKGNLDTSYMALVKELKCTRPECKGWLIPFSNKHLSCEACRNSRE